MQPTIIHKKTISVLIITAGLAVILGRTLVTNPHLAVALALLPLVWYLFFADKKYVLFLFIVISPFAYAPLLSRNIMGITGAKPFNLAAALCLAAFFFHGGRLLPEDDAEKKILLGFLLYFMVFSVATFRTFQYLPLLHQLWPDVFHAAPVRHFLSSYVQPGLYFIPFIFIIKLIKTDEDMAQTVRIVCFSGFVLSLAVLSISLSNFSLIVQSRTDLRELFNTFLGMHYNAVGSLYITIYPLILHQAFSKKPFDIANLMAAISAVLFLQSRSTVMIVLVSTYLYLFLSGKKAHIIWLTAFLACVVAAWLPFFLLRTFQTGLDRGDLNAVFTNRIEMIWMPLITEWIGDGKLLLFGKGRYAILTSIAYRKGNIFEVTHAHNAYLDFFLNCGLILTVILIGFLVWSLWLAWKIGRKINDRMFWALCLCVLAFLIGGFTQRDFLPKHENLFLFPVTALMINYALSKVREIR